MARAMAQREADERVAAARARRIERAMMTTREGEEAERERNLAAAEAEMANQPPPTLVVSPGGGVWVAKAEKQEFDDCFLTDDEIDENDVEAQKKKTKSETTSAASPTADSCCEKGKSDDDALR